MHEMSILLPHLLAEKRGKLDVYFSRVYNPVWTNPNGFAWIEALTIPAKVGLHAALTPTWNESAFFADYVLPMGLGSERHDLHSYETHDAQWLGFRQSVLRAARERLGTTAADSRDDNPGEVWEENEFWIALSWRIDPDGTLGIRQYFESRERPGEQLTVDEYYGYIFDHSVPGLPERAQAEGLTPLGFMRRYGAFEVRRRSGSCTRNRSRRTSWSTRASIASAAPTRAAKSPRRRTSSRSLRRRAMRRDGAPSGCASTASSCAASRRRAAGSSSTRRRSSSGAGRNTRCRRTSRVTCTPTIWNRDRWC